MNQMIEVKSVAETAEYRYARGWHCLGEAEAFRDGKLHTLNVFGSRLLGFVGKDNQIAVLDAYCPHMGADLSQGELVDGKVVCPFHHWAFDASGRCAEIPYCKRIPPKAKTRKWLTCEVNRLLFVWHNPEGLPPAEGVEIPYFPEIDSDEWDNDWHLDLMVIDTHPRELVDNLVDAQHFGPVHGAPTKYFRNTFQGHIGTQEFHGDSERLGGDLVAESAYYGPSTHFTRMRAEYDGLTVETILLNCHVPIGPRQFELRFGVLVKKIPGWTEEQNEKLALEYVENNRTSFYQDVDIWSTKRPVDNPVLAEGDGPIYQLREWYAQFYTNEADIPPQMAEHREFITVNKP